MIEAPILRFLGIALLVAGIVAFFWPPALLVWRCLLAVSVFILLWRDAAGR